MKKIVTVVGARPQFIKAAAVSRIIRKEFHEVLIHTGQHYDENMSDIFFKELEIPEPDYNLEIGSKSHGEQTGEILIGTEKVLLKEKPGCLLVYGDTNSTLAGALAASKLHIPVIHIEAGLRSFNKKMPEEQNRILTDHISELLFCSTAASVEWLRQEGIVSNVYHVGDVMCDAALYYTSQKEKNTKETHLEKLTVWYGDKKRLKHGWYLATVHRAENTDSIEKIDEILSAFEELDTRVIFPVHPRTKGMVEKLCLKRQYKNLICTEPMGYKEMLYFTKEAKKVITDSGGLQKEAYILKTPCITVRDQTEWVETLTGGHNILAKPEKQDIVRKILDTKQNWSLHPNYYGDGNAAEKICSVLKNQF